MLELLKLELIHMMLSFGWIYINLHSKVKVMDDEEISNYKNIYFQRFTNQIYKIEEVFLIFKN